MTVQILKSLSFSIICPWRIFLSLAILLIGHFASSFPLLTYQHFPLDGFFVLSTFFVLVYPLVRINYFLLEGEVFEEKLPLLAKVSLSLTLSLAMVATLCSIGVFKNTFFSLSLLSILSSFSCYLMRDKPFLPALTSLRTTLSKIPKVEWIILSFCLFLSLYYSYKYLLFYPYSIADADSASVAELSVLQFQSFPKVENTLPVVLDHLNAPKLSTVHLIQSPFISSLAGALALATHSDVSRSLYWLWLLSSLTLFLSAASLVWSLFRGSAHDLKNFSTWAPAMVLIFHNFQFQFGFVGGQVQELFTFSLLYTALNLFVWVERSDNSWPLIFSGFAMGASIAFQPDLAFPWAFGLSLFALVKIKKFRSLLLFAGGGIIALSPFLLQQLMNYLDTGLSASHFVKRYQILYTPLQYMEDFSYTIIFYGIFLSMAILFKSHYRKLIIHFFIVFLFFIAYPWVIYFFKGEFTDIIFPFTGKYYFRLMGISWFLTMAASLGILSFYKKLACPPYQIYQKKVGLFISIILFSSLLIEHKRRYMFFTPVTTLEKVKGLNQIKRDFHLQGKILTNYDMSNWWVGPVLNSQSSPGRIETSESDLFINYKYKDRLYTDYFWQKITSSSASLDEKIQELAKAAQFYDYIIADLGNPTLCQTVKTSQLWQFLGERETYCIFSSRD